MFVISVGLYNTWMSKVGLTANKFFIIRLLTFLTFILIKNLLAVRRTLLIQKKTNGLVHQLRLEWKIKVVFLSLLKITNEWIPMSAGPP
jgi:hypothetical protein